jgi:hypothetical protein
LLPAPGDRWSLPAPKARERFALWPWSGCSTTISSTTVGPVLRFRSGRSILKLQAILVSAKKSTMMNKGLVFITDISSFLESGLFY